MLRGCDQIGQRVALDLAARAFRQCGHAADQARYLVGRKSFARELPKLVRSCFGVRAQHHDGGDVFAELLMRDGEHAGLQHRRMAQQDLFDLQGRDLLPAAVDDVLDAADDEEVAVGVEIAEVAGPEPAVAEGGPCRRLVIIIAAAHVRPAQHDLAMLAARKRAARPVHDRDLGARSAADRSDLAQLERIGGDLRGCFRHAVGLEHGNAEHRLQPVQDRRRERG